MASTVETHTRHYSNVRIVPVLAYLRNRIVPDPIMHLIQYVFFPVQFGI